MSSPSATETTGLPLIQGRGLRRYATLPRCRVQREFRRDASIWHDFSAPARALPEARIVGASRMNIRRSPTLGRQRIAIKE
jgi:hypothetical protein